MQDTEVLQTEAEENWRAASAGTRLLKSSEARRVGLACSIGTAIERYDFFIYGTAAAVVFAPQFFPQISELMARLAVAALRRSLPRRCSAWLELHGPSPLIS